MKVLALDPALVNTAAALFEDGKLTLVEVIKLPPSKDKWLTVAEKDRQRVEDLAKKILYWMDAHKPDVVCVEQAQGGARSAMAVKALSMVAGCIYALSAATGDKTNWVHVRVHDVKRAVTGKAHATKDQMIQAAVDKYPELRPHLVSERGGKWKGEAEHIADAVAVYEAYQLSPVGRVMCAGG